MRKSKLAFTLTETLVCIAIVAVVASISFLIIRPMREKAKQTQCASQLKQFYVAATLYSADNSSENDGWFPGSDISPNAPRDIFLNKAKYGLSREMLFCPLVPNHVKKKNIASSYQVPFYRITSRNAAHHEFFKRRANLEYEKLGNQFPMLICHAHDYYFYNPPSSATHSSLRVPFLVILRLNGSVTARFEPDMLSNQSIFENEL